MVPEEGQPRDLEGLETEGNVFERKILQMVVGTDVDEGKWLDVRALAKSPLINGGGRNDEEIDVFRRDLVKHCEGALTGTNSSVWFEVIRVRFSPTGDEALGTMINSFWLRRQ